MAEITRRSVLLECLQEMEAKLSRASKNGRALEPLRGYEEEFDVLQRKCEVIRELIHAYESEPVRRSIANWQQEIMDGKRPQLMDTVQVVPPIKEERVIF